MKVAVVKAAVTILDWAQHGEPVAWIPEDGTEIIYGTLEIEDKYLDSELEDVMIQIRSNRGFTLKFHLPHMIHKYENELFYSYDWGSTKLVRMEGLA